MTKKQIDKEFDKKFPVQNCNADYTITDCDYTWDDIKQQLE